MEADIFNLREYIQNKALERKILLLSWRYVNSLHNIILYMEKLEQYFV